MESINILPVQMVKDPSYINVFDFEKFDMLGAQIWFAENWKLAFYLALAYVILIFSGQRFMKNRNPLQLRTGLFLWNLCLALYSMAGFVRTFPHLYHVLSGPNGFHRSVCSRDNEFDFAMTFWTYTMAISKVAELGDTFFIVTRKQPLIILHWYHHFATMIFAFVTFPSFDSCNRYFVCINFAIHSIMYSYFALRSRGIKIPKWISAQITTLQIVQMIIGVTVNFYTLYIKGQNKPCDRVNSNVYLSLAMYFSYLVLFGNFFVQSYLKKPKTKQIEDLKKVN